MVERTHDLLQVKDLRVGYGHLIGLRSLDVTVQAGEISVMLGANGAGKSSALNAIAGSVKSRAGRIVFDGVDITRKPAWKISQAGLVLVPEGRHIIGPLTVSENLRLGAFGRGSARQAREGEEEIYEIFPMLAEHRRSLGGLLSGGQQQLLAFGRALMAKPKLILLDEPSMGLAPIMVDRVLEAVVSIAGRGIGVLMVEQNAAALDVAHQAAVLEQGMVVVRGTPKELLADDRVTQAFLGVA
ncbi:ABC transporter ATP-binding protein [Microbacterium sp. A94]|uniref:ABC transporter ATP-binding protein n=1 Tax=Microbacterium sp. A94 TaxID=3450717 RepID=UPI003F42FD45